MLQDEVVNKYSLSSLTLEKFFLGPLPECLSTRSVTCTARPPALNGCLLSSTQNGLAGFSNDVIIDLTDDDPEVMVVADNQADTLTDLVHKNRNFEVPLNAVPKKTVITSKRPVQKKQTVEIVRDRDTGASKIVRDIGASKKIVRTAKSSVRQHNGVITAGKVVRRKHAAISKSSAQKHDLSAKKHNSAISVVRKKRVKAAKSFCPKRNAGVATVTDVSEECSETSRNSVLIDDFEIPAVTVISQKHVVAAKRGVEKHQRVKSGRLVYIYAFSLLICNCGFNPKPKHPNFAG